MTAVSEEFLEWASFHRPKWLSKHHPDWMVKTYPELMIWYRRKWVAKHYPEVYIAHVVMKPCPFCGGLAKKVDIDPTDKHNSNAGGSYIMCTNCYACSAIMFGAKDGLEEKWDRRVNTSQEPAARVIEYQKIKQDDIEKSFVHTREAPKTLPPKPRGKG